MTAHDNAQDVFGAARKIVDTLAGLKDNSMQLRALKYAAEELNLHISEVALSTAAKPPQAPFMAGPSISSAMEGMHPPGPPETPSHGAVKNIKQFTNEKSPKSDQQFAAVVAYYYRFEAQEEEKKESITSDDILDAARLSGRNRPSQPRMTLTNAKNAGYLDSVGHGRYKISSVGENLVAITLPESNSSEATNPARRKRSNKKKTSAKKSSKKTVTKKPSSAGRTKK